MLKMPALAAAAALLLPSVALAQSAQCNAYLNTMQGIEKDIVAVFHKYPRVADQGSPIDCINLRTDLRQQDETEPFLLSCLTPDERAVVAPKHQADFAAAKNRASQLCDVTLRLHQ